MRCYTSERPDDLESLIDFSPPETPTTPRSPPPWPSHFVQQTGTWSVIAPDSPRTLAEKDLREETLRAQTPTEASVFDDADNSVSVETVTANLSIVHSDQNANMAGSPTATISSDRSRSASGESTLRAQAEPFQ